MLVHLFGTKETAKNILKPIPQQQSPSCCGTSEAESLSIKQKVVSSFAFGFGQLLRDFMLWFMLGIFFAALVTTFVPQSFFTQHGQGVLAMLVVVLVSIPMYVCATASTPIAVGLLLSGISPGAALVFMLTGPATNIATLMVIKNELGKRELIFYLIAIVASAIFAGLTLDWLFTYFNWQLDLSHGAHSDMMGAVYQASALILAGLILFQMQKRYLPRVFSADTSA
jgi:hypothetical protein